MLLNLFIDHLCGERNYSPHTLRSYKTDISQFETFILDMSEGSRSVLTLTHLDIRRWVAYQMEQGLSARTINRKLSALDTFYRFLCEQGKMETNPVDRVTRPKIRKKLAPFVRERTMDELFEEVLPEVSDFSSARARIIFELLYLTGMRLSELLALQEKDFDWNKMLVKVKGKNSKERMIPLAPSLQSIYESYLTFRPFKDSHLLLTDKGKPLYPKFVYRLVHKMLSQVTSISRRSPHIMRHSFATSLLGNGADLNAIKELLGHANLATTQVYTHNTKKEVSRIYKQAHPRA